MLVRPLGHETAGAAGKVAVEQVTCGDVHLRLVLAIAGVEVRRPVVLVVEVDGDPVEEAQARQATYPSPRMARAPTAAAVWSSPGSTCW